MSILGSHCKYIVLLRQVYRNINYRQMSKNTETIYLNGGIANYSIPHKRNRKLIETIKQWLDDFIA